MHIVARFRVVLLILAIVLVANGGRCLAQGSAGGSVGNDEKSLSGTRSEPAGRDVRQNSRPVKKVRQSAPARPAARSEPAGCTLVRTETATPGCFGYVGYSKGARVGWLRRKGMYIRSGSVDKCPDGGVQAALIGPDAFRLADGTRERLDAGCNNGQEY